MESTLPCPWSLCRDGPALWGWWLLAAGMGSDIQKCPQLGCGSPSCTLTGQLEWQGCAPTHRVSLFHLSLHGQSKGISVDHPLRGGERLLGCPSISLFALGEETPPALSLALAEEGRHHLKTTCK